MRERERGNNSAITVDKGGGGGGVAGAKGQVIGSMDLPTNCAGVDDGGFVIIKCG